MDDNFKSFKLLEKSQIGRVSSYLKLMMIEMNFYSRKFKKSFEYQIENKKTNQFTELVIYFE